MFDTKIIFVQIFKVFEVLVLSDLFLTSAIFPGLQLKLLKINLIIRETDRIISTKNFVGIFCRSLLVLHLDLSSTALSDPNR